MLKILFLPLDLVKLVEETVRAENARRPNSPIYLIGESFGGCLALAVAARNPQIHFLLMLENPGETKFFFFFIMQIAYLVAATCFQKSQLQPLLSLLELMPEQVHPTPTLIHMLSLMSGAVTYSQDPVMPIVNSVHSNQISVLS